MAPADPATTPHQSRLFLGLYALAACGGAVAYVPLLTIILPALVSAEFGSGALKLLAQLAFVGAVAASLANIFFGWVSDRLGDRRTLTAGGALLSSLLLLAVPYVETALGLLALIACWQIALNMMLAPLGAWAGDMVPDEQKGALGGLLAFAPAVGAASGYLASLPWLGDAHGRVMLIAGMVIVMVMPVLFWVRPVNIPQLSGGPSPHFAASGDAASRYVVARMWLARLLVQISEAALFAFLLLWFRSIAPGFAEHDAARIFALVLALAVVAALAAGWWSDRVKRPILPLCLAAMFASIGLLVMATAGDLDVALAGYVTFGVASGIFLALHSSQTLRVLPAPAHRGRDLGIFNLTNTVPSLIMPPLTLALVPSHGFGALFLVLAGLASAAALILASVAGRIDHAGRRA